ncbi:hypothetical protein EHS25_001914 [Saitozyma podzolica]|uniref:Concanavalin A-like lectin/glucanase n=1 Tax=Saitozyma podzolica TaxID=1890683 RepID=A0A427YFQ4_9TREE|nr:hypothetical protein EHS25_001914 [Saitozyma podzolica]
MTHPYCLTEEIRLEDDFLNFRGQSTGKAPSTDWCTFSLAAMFQDRFASYIVLWLATLGVVTLGAPPSFAWTNFDSNWAGPVYNSNAGTFKSVTGTFTVPTPSAPPDGSPDVQYAATAWVGIDGNSCKRALLQTGVNFYVQDGRVSYGAWSEWFPATQRFFHDITFATGDEVKLTVNATSTTSGRAVIENLATGQTVTRKLTSSSALFLQDAECIVGDFKRDGSLVPFSNFGSVAFTNAEATTSEGATEGPSDASFILDIQQNNKVLTSVTKSRTGAIINYV